RWKEQSGQEVLDLRALVLSARWDAAMALTLAPLRAQVHRTACSGWEPDPGHLRLQFRDARILGVEFRHEWWCVTP
ncbi:hypothetical protein, partial [Corallococcus sp. RDP092CA]|uniref:hypothetical protein n=1 Tax=Corallococcus sp. RDP092CA TaxID=3109369 RepID=UPI0035B2A0E2